MAGYTPLSAIPDIVAGVKAEYYSGKTRSVTWRRTQLRSLGYLVKDNEDQIYGETMTANCLCCPSDAKDGHSQTSSIKTSVEARTSRILWAISYFCIRMRTPAVCSYCPESQAEISTVVNDIVETEAKFEKWTKASTRYRCLSLSDLY